MCSVKSANAFERLPEELHELILLQLDLRTLLTSAQRVNHTWAALVKESTALQQQLFFAPDVRISSEDMTHNALLLDAFPSLFFKLEIDNDDHKFTFQSWDMIKHPEKQPSYLRPDASWRRMLVQQPPIYRLGIWTESFATIPTTTYYEIPDDPTITQSGLRMETVFEDIIFSPDLPVAGVQIIWWGNFSPMVRRKIEQLQSLRQCNFDVGLVLNGGHSSEDFVQDSDEEEEDPEEKQVQKAAEEIQSATKSTCEKLGYQFKIEDKGRWTKREMYCWD